MTRIWDTFMVGNDLDQLECRLVELDASAIWRHVVVESPQTHQGSPKPLWFAEHKERFAPWADRIVHVITPDLPDDPNPWVRENTQREYVTLGLAQAGAGPDDVILHGDVDEIPRAEAVTAAAVGRVFAGPQYIFAVDWLDPRGEWPGTVAMYGQDIGTFSDMRIHRDIFPRMPGTGWHLTWLGGPAAISRKLGTFRPR